MSYRFLNYDLPKDRIAQLPAAATGSRSDSRLLHVRAVDSGVSIEDLKVSEIARLFRPGDLLVLNNSRVLPSRFFAYHIRTHDNGGNNRSEFTSPSIGSSPSSREIEVLLVKKISLIEQGERWSALARPMRLLKPLDRIRLSNSLVADVVGRDETGDRIILDISIDSTADGETILQLIEREGVMPIPGYIRGGRADEADMQFYQTVFAKESGSIAAPTAGLHFTSELLAELQQLGVAIVYVSLHVGVASFAPVREISTHKMPSEHFIVRQDVLEAIRSTRDCGGRVVVVGTTAVRALESAMLAANDERKADSGQKAEDNKKDLIEGDTEIFITPGHKFLAVDVLMTNFHQPETTHLLLVAAFIGEDNVEPIYQYALQKKYRFLSYGDAMFLERSL